MLWYDIKQDVEADQMLDVGTVMLSEPNKRIGLLCGLLSSFKQSAYLMNRFQKDFEQYAQSQEQHTGVCAPRSLASVTAFACRSLICIYRAFPRA